MHTTAVRQPREKRDIKLSRLAQQSIPEPSLEWTSMPLVGRCLGFHFGSRVCRAWVGRGKCYNQAGVRGSVSSEDNDCAVDSLGDFISSTTKKGGNNGAAGRYHTTGWPIMEMREEEARSGTIMWRAAGGSMGESSSASWVNVMILPLVGLRMVIGYGW
jgi:hypothetical protein